MTSQERSGQAPILRLNVVHVLQVNSARVVRWHGAFGIHPSIAVKRAGAQRFTTYHIAGWRARTGGDATVTIGRDAPDLLWFGPTRTCWWTTAVPRPRP